MIRPKYKKAFGETFEWKYELGNDWRMLGFCQSAFCEIELSLQGSRPDVLSFFAPNRNRAHQVFFVENCVFF